ncbi:MAG: copper amine oxidase N-terminal domain-containing protein [Clostridia bacterium]|nr:copper amine oxidase N-terminal domain-containing protein [Clostridia bacterium]
MKKIIVSLVTIMMIFCFTTLAFATDNAMLISALEENLEDTLLIAPNQNSEIKVQQNGEYIDFKDSAGNIVNPQIINNRTMVPFRKIFNSLGVTDENISWNGETKTVVAKKDGLQIELQIDNTIAKKQLSGEEMEIKLDSAPVIIEGRTLVPVRFIAESMNKKVGWDADNRTVIIIDTQELTNDLTNAIPKYMKLLNEESQLSKTYAMKTNVKGKIEYTSKDNKSDNSTLNISGTVNTNVKEKAIAIDMNLKLTGKGELYNTLKENKFTNIVLNIIASEDKIYIKSSTLEERAKGKWIAYENDSLKQTFELKNEETISLEQLFELDENDLNINTYQSLKTISNIIKALLKDENIQITEKGSTKSYTITMKFSEIKNLIKDIESVDNSLDNYDGSIKLTTSLKNNKIQTNGSEIKFEYVEGTESINVALNLDGKIVKSSNISIPSDSQIMNADEIE